MWLALRWNSLSPNPIDSQGHAVQLQTIIRTAISVVLLGIFILHSSQTLPIQALDRLDKWFYDVRLNLTLENTVDPRIVIVDVDEKSLSEQGRWPWPRVKLAKMVDNLFDEYQIRAMGFDMVFAEPDRSSGLEILDSLASDELADNNDFFITLESLRSDLEYDRMFGESLAGRKIVSGFYFKNYLRPDEPPTTHKLQPGSVRIDKRTMSRLSIPKPKGYTANLPEVQENSMATGFFDNPTLDSDGVFRRVPLLQIHNDEIYESLALSLTRLALDLPPPEILIEQNDDGGSKYFELEYIKLGPAYIPVDGKSSVLVPYRGPQGSFPYISATDVINGKVNAEQLNDRVVLLGTTAPGLLDLRTTPVQESYAGVEVHANIISGILDGRIKHQPEYLLGYDIIVLILLAALMTWLMPKLSPVKAAVLALGLIVIVILSAFIAWSYFNLVLPMAGSITMLFLLFVMHLFYGFFIESRGKRQLAQMFSEYVPPELVDEMSGNPADYSLEAESKELTVLFSDVRGFTSISESLEAQELSELINEFLTPMTRVIHQNRGTIDKYMGDAIMAFWGAPLADIDHAHHAVQAAFEMIEALNQINLEFQKRNWPQINIGIGLNTGPMNVGNMGSEFRRAYTVMGDAVNLGSRLEGLTKTYGVQIIVSENVVKSTPSFDYLELDCVRVKGKDEPVHIYQPLGQKGTVDKKVRDEGDLFKRAYQFYAAQDWDNAEMQLFALTQQHPDKPLYSLYMERIKHFRANPPGDDWDRVFTHINK